jgi:hypothetical protein
MAGTFQQFMSTDVSPDTVITRPVRDDSISNAIDQLAPTIVEETANYLDRVGDEQEKSLNQSYFQNLEVYRQLKAQGKDDEAARHLADSNLKFAKAGGDLASSEVRGLRTSLGIDGEDVMTQEESIQEILEDSEEFKMSVLAVSTDTRWKDLPADQQRAEAERRAKLKIGLQESIDVRNLTAEANGPQIDLLAATYASDIEGMVSGVIANFDIVGPQVLADLGVELQRSKGRTVNEMVAAGLDADVAKEKVNDAYATAEAMLEISNDKFSDKAQDRAIVHATVELMRDYIGKPIPGTDTIITKEDFNHYLALTAMGGAERQEYLSGAQGSAAFEANEKSIKLIGAIGHGLRFLERVKPLVNDVNVGDAEINQSNGLRENVQQLTDSWSSGESMEVAQSIVDSVNNMDVTQVPNHPRLQHQVLLAGAYASEGVSKALEDGKYISTNQMRRLFSDKLVDTLINVKDLNPAGFVDVVDYVGKAKTEYTRQYKNTKDFMFNNFAVTIDDETGEVSWNVQLAAQIGVFDAGDPANRDTNRARFIKRAAEIYGESTEENAGLAFLNSPFEMFAQLGLEMEEAQRAGDQKLAGELARLQGIASQFVRDKPNVKGLVNFRESSEFLTGQYVKLRGAFDTISNVQEGSIGEFEPLRPFLEVVEADSYDTLFGNAEVKDTPFKGFKVSEMTIGEVKHMGRFGGDYRKYADSVNTDLATTGSGAPFGKYQFVPDSLKRAQALVGLPDEALFSPANQDKLFVAWARKSIGNTKDPEVALRKLQGTWPGLKSKDIDQAQLLEAVKKIIGVV